ncbi:MAG TPA: carboxypeptidase-like regulatory domain-containing protein, partial [Planctomycetota bacterium]|nr:carboxypeptidase-like regulatory domain-containing protein [Planctomycetota bacterium]
MAPSRAAALGALVVLAVGAAVWWLGARSDPAPAGRPVAPVPTPESPARPDLPSEMPVPPTPKGTGIVAGRLVRRSATDSVAGEITLDFSGAAPVSARTGGRGSFRVEGLPVGPAFTLTATSAGCLPARWQGLRVPFEGVLDLGDIEVGSGHSLEILVTRGAMQPAEGILVTLQRQPPDGSEDADDLPGSGAMPPATPVGRWTTDAAGRALLREVPPGAWFVRVEGPGLGPEARPIVFREGEAVAPLRIHLAPAHPLSGTVRLPGGGPAPGVAVVARHESWWMRGVGDLISVTGPDGRYRFDGLPEASMAILVRPVAGCLRPVTKLMIPDLATLDITLEDGVVLRGRVVEDAGGAAVAGARVTGRVWPRGLGGGDATATADSGPDGSFELAGLPAGELAELTARKSGFLPAEIGTIGTDEPVAPGTTVEKELRLRRGGAVRGTVRDSAGNPVAGAVLRMLCFPDEKRGIHAWSARRSVARTREDGSYLLAPCVPGKGALTVDAAGYRHADAPEDLGEAMETGRVPASIVVEVVEGGECVKDLELSTSGIVEGQVRDADGRPMAGFTVAVWEVDGTGGESSAPATDVEGRFRAEGVSPGKSRRVMAWGPGARGESTPFAIGPGETVRDVTVVVAARTGIAGTVRTRDGSPLVDARIHIVNGLGGMLSSMPLEMLGHFGGETRFLAADGSFRAENLEPGEYAIVVFARGCAPIVVPEVAVEAGAMTEGIEIVLAAGRRLEGRVVDGDGNPLRDARVYLVQHPVGLRTDALLRQVTGEDGRFALSDLAEGTVELIIRGPGRPQVRRTVETGARDLVVVLEDGLRVAGTVVDAATGSGIPGVRVVVKPVGAEHDVFGFLADRLEVHRAQTDARGAFSVEDLASGSFVVVVGRGPLADGAASDYAPLEVKGVKAGTEDLRLELTRGLAISGRLVDPEGRPVPERFHVEASPFGQDGRREHRKRVEAGTGEEGAFRVAGLPAGEYELRFSPGAGRFSIRQESPSAFG